MFLTYDDLVVFSPDIPRPRAEALITGAEALAVTYVPELADLADKTKREAVKMILIQAIIRNYETGTPGTTTRTESTGPFSSSLSFEPRPTSRTLFWPSEIEDMRKIALGVVEKRAFSIDLAPGMSATAHSTVCDVHFGVAHCSCLSTINNGAAPLYEGGILSRGSAL